MKLRFSLLVLAAALSAFSSLRAQTTGSSVSNEAAARLVAAHNAERARLGLEPVSWDPTLAAYAQKWADQLASECQIRHRSGGDNTKGYGENIAMGSGEFTVISAFDLWMKEKRGFKNGRFTNAMMKRGHYTQIIWGSTTAIGCGVATCGDMTIVVCNYNPPGNMMGARVY